MTDPAHLPAQRPRSCRCESCRFTASVQRVQAKLSRHDRAVIDKLLCAGYVWIANFDDGDHGWASKIDRYRCRAVRRVPV